MAVRLLNPDSALLALTLELRYTLSRAQADPLAAFLIPIFQPLSDQCTVVLNQELALQVAISDAQAQVDIADENLDDFASRLAKAVLVITKDDKTDPLFVHFFNKKALSIFTRPKLGSQLEAQRSWIDDLTTSLHPTLQSMAAELTGLVAAADKATDARTNAAAQNRNFRDVGARRQLFDKVNAARKSADGDLAKLAIETPGLSSAFPAKFFRAAPVAEAAAEPTIDSITQDIKDLETRLAAAQKQLQALNDAADAAKKAEAEKQANEAALAELLQQETDLAKKKVEIQQKLGKK